VRLYQATKARNDLGKTMPVDQCYRRYASECIRLAQRMSDAHDRTILDRMASAWILLAERYHADSRDSANETVSSPAAKQPQQ
jgi:hypothetical protein